MNITKSKYKKRIHHSLRLEVTDAPTITIQGFGTDHYVGRPEMILISWYSDDPLYHRTVTVRCAVDQYHDHYTSLTYAVHIDPEMGTVYKLAPEWVLDLVKDATV